MTDDQTYAQQIRRIDQELSEMAYDHNRLMREISQKRETLFALNRDLRQLYESDGPSIYRSQQLDKIRQRDFQQQEMYAQMADRYKREYRRKETEKLVRSTAEVWDERGIMTYIEASGIDKSAYQKRLGELHMSDAVKNYLLNGSSSGLSITEMSYDQLQELRKGMNLLNEIEDYDKAENACQEYYQRKGRERAYNKKEVV